MTIDPSSGIISWTPAIKDTGSYSITAFVSDADTNTSISWNLRVNRANRKPVLINPENQTVNENATLTFFLSASDSDNNALTYSAEGATGSTPMSGKVFSWTPNYAQSDTYSVKFIVTDNGTPALSDTETITITVNDVSLTVTDFDGNVYSTVSIGTQVWTVENLKTTKLNDGTIIPMVTTNTAWTALIAMGYCYPDGNSTNKSAYGLLYNWYTVNTGKLEPPGWHIATDAEWDTLVTFLGGRSVAGGKLKEAGTVHWASPNTDATNVTGFSAFGGGHRNEGGSFSYAFYFRDGGYWWSSTENGVPNAFSRYLTSTDGNIEQGNHSKGRGHSVRLIKD
jgi:uncharacterized protein (TIGR02145 family)